MAEHPELSAQERERGMAALTRWVAAEARSLAGSPVGTAEEAAAVLRLVPRPPLTRNQVELMQIDTTASDNLPGFRVLGISPRSLEEELEAMLKQSK